MALVALLLFIGDPTLKSTSQVLLLISALKKTRSELSNAGFTIDESFC